MVESTDHETGISDATSTEVWSQDSDEGSGFILKHFSCFRLLFNKQDFHV
jgi:hypothetical protein